MPKLRVDNFSSCSIGMRPDPPRAAAIRSASAAGRHPVFDMAFEAARGMDVRLGGGVSTVQQCLSAGLVDEPVIDGTL